MRLIRHSYTLGLSTVRPVNSQPWCTAVEEEKYFSCEQTINADSYGIGGIENTVHGNMNAVHLVLMLDGITDDEFNSVTYNTI